MPDDRRLFAVLIDADNISARHAEAILKEITTFGEPALRRVYGDWSSWSAKVRDLGLVAKQETANTTGKNASDIGLVIDAMDILHSGRFDGFVIVSSDSDFTALANRIREQGLDVIGIGMKTTPDSLRSVCNRFVLIENIVDPPSDKAASSKTDPSKAAPLIRQAMDKIDPDNEWYHLGQVGQAIQSLHPDFDTRTYGKQKLSDLVTGLKEFELRRGAGNIIETRRKP